jgi:hypothetical protein
MILNKLSLFCWIWSRVETRRSSQLSNSNKTRDQAQGQEAPATPPISGSRQRASLKT